jgi:hypothetical protein
MGKKGAVCQLFIDTKKAYNSVRKEVFYYILIQTVIPMKLVRTIKMCLTETCSRLRVGENLISFLLGMVWKKKVFFGVVFNFGLEFAIWKVQETPNSLLLNGTHQLLVCAVDVNIMVGSVNTAGNKPGSSFSRY